MSRHAEVSPASPSLIGLVAAILLSSPSAAADERFCADYANGALELYRAAREVGCPDLSYPLWSMDYDHHYGWCLRTSEDEVRRGGQRREEALQTCKASIAARTESATTPGDGSSQHRACTTYAQTAVAQQTRNTEHGCGLRGAEWNPVYDDHYRWCMGLADLTPARNGQQQREEALARCTATSEASGSLVPIPIPEQPSPPAVEQGWTQMTTVPALDPGIGGRVPDNVDLQRAARRATTPPSRLLMVQDLLASPAARRQLQALPHVRGAPENLAYQTLDGHPVTQSVSPAGSPAQTAAGSVGMAPSSGPTLPKGVDWHAGIQFNPFTRPPLYHVGGQTRTLGTVRVLGVEVSTLNTEAMTRDRVVFLDRNAEMHLEVDLPNETATYLVAFGLSTKDHSTLPTDSYQGESAPIQGLAYEVERYRQTPLVLAPLSGGGGFVAVFSTQRDPSASEVVTPVWLVLTADGLGEGFLFGGITLTRL